MMKLRILIIAAAAVLIGTTPTHAEPFPCIVATESSAVVAPADNIFFAERIPDGYWEDLGVFRSSGYCNCPRCCGKWAYGPTKCGVMPVEGVTIATDPKVIPTWSKVMVNGKVYTAHDTGKHIKGKRIDIYYSDHKRASDHGFQYPHVFVWREYPITDGKVINDLEGGGND